MKNVKFLIVALLLVLGFVLQSEIFQTECFNFNTGYYLSCVFSYADEEERCSFLRELEELSEKMDVQVFATNIETLNKIERNMTIYGNENVKRYVEEKHEISEGKYRSVMLGNITVRYCDFEELAQYQNRYINVISFIGEDENIYQIYHMLHDKYELEYPMISGSNESDMIYIVWGMIAALMVLLTSIEIMYHKKEMVIRVSMGEDEKSYIVKTMLLEIVADMVIFILVKHFVFNFISGEFMKWTVIKLYATGVILSCICYCSYGNYDIKKAFANVNDSKGVLYLTYVIRAVMTAISLVTITTNISILNELFFSGEEKMVEEYSEYSYLNVRDIAISVYYNIANERMTEKFQIQEDIFREYYEEVKPVVCFSTLMDEYGYTYVCANEYADKMLGNFIEGIDKGDEDVIVFMPKGCNKELADEYTGYCLKELLSDTDNVTIKTITYSNKHLTYIDAGASYGVRTVWNPIIVYSKVSGNDNMEKLNIPFNNSILYCFSDESITEIQKQFQLDERGYKLVTTRLVDYYEYHKSAVRRGIAFFSSLCSIMVILQLMLIISINKMEYRFNAMEMSLKKILGYGLLKKNRRIFVSTVIFYFPIIGVISLAGFITRFLPPLTCVMVGIVMMFMELLVILLNIIKIEQCSVHKILKGGSL